MTLQNLNIWAGLVYDELLEHMKTQASIIDIFCFQEVYNSQELTYTRGDVWDGGPGLSQAHRARANIYQELERALPEFRAIYHAAQSLTTSGISMSWKRSFPTSPLHLLLHSCA